MQSRWGTPPEPGRYDCVFEDGTRDTYDIVEIKEDGTCLAQGIDYPIYLKRITQYLGPFPDPLMKPEFPEPFRRFNVTHRDGRIGTGVYNPSKCFVGQPYLIRWQENSFYQYFYSAELIKKHQIEWIDEKPEKDGDD